MRILFLTLYPDDAASPRYRVSQFLPYLRNHGVDCTVAAPLTAQEWASLTGPARRRRPFWYHRYETPRRIRQILGAGRYDVVFVQKAIMTAYVRGMAGLLRRCARRIVYDIDDAVHLAPPHGLGIPWRVFEDRGQIGKVMAMADLVLAGNAWLQEAAEATGAQAVRFPTVVDTDRFTPVNGNETAYRIGWMGNPSTTACLAPVRNVLNSVQDAEVYLVGADAAVAGLPRVEHRLWSLKAECDELRRFSVGIMPLPDEEWMKGKCALKALLYMACGIPCVASPVGAVLEIIRNGENGFIARNDATWQEAFDVLRDPALRRQIGAAGRATVESDYALSKAAPRFLELLETVV